jgi:putative ABC transport system ATP-binding protein
VSSEERGLALERVSKRYRDGVRGEVTAVREASLSIAPGEVLVLRGASGAGKSTLLGLAAGLVLPTAGEVRFRGEVFSRLRESYRARVRREAMGVVLQGLALVPRMTALENVLLAHVPDGSIDADHIAKARVMLERFGIAPLAGSNIDTLSGGERQRVALARAFLRQPSLVLLDEPTAHLDATHVATLAALVEEHRSRGAMILLATHDPRISDAVAGARRLDIADGAIAPHDG